MKGFNKLVFATFLSASRLFAISRQMEAFDRELHTNTTFNSF